MYMYMYVWWSEAIINCCTHSKIYDLGSNLGGGVIIILLLGHTHTYTSIHRPKLSDNNYVYMHMYNAGLMTLYQTHLKCDNDNLPIITYL